MSLALQKGEILVLDSIAYRITKSQRMRHKESITFTSSQTDKTTDLSTNLTPEKEQIYFIEEIDWIGPTRHMFQYPKGTPLHTPHGIDVKIEEWQCPFTVNVHVKEATYPTLVSDNLVAAAITQEVWFYGWMYNTEVITVDEVEGARRAGIRVLEVER